MSQEFLASTFAIVSVLVYCAFLIVVVGGMAERRGRSPVAWVLIAVFISIPIAIIGLLIMGDK